MPSPRRYFWGIGFKIVMFFGIPAGVTLLLLWGLFVPLAQKIMFDHEMTDLADETELRGAELADQTQSLIGEFQSLARLIEEGNSRGLTERCRLAAQHYLLIEVIETSEMEGEFVPLKVDSDSRFGFARAPEENPSYRQFRTELIERLRHDRSSERIHTKLSKARLPLVATDSASRTEEAHVFWAGGQIIPATADSNGKILLMGLGLDDRFARMGSTPRHMTVVVDQQGRLILNPFDRKQVSDEAGNFILPAAAPDEPFENAPWLKTLSDYALHHVDWDQSQLSSIILPFLNQASYSTQGLLLPPGVKYYYWESKDVGLTGEETAIALPTLRRMALELADQEWRADSEQEVAPLQRAGGLSTTVSTLRLLASSVQELETLHKNTVKTLRTAFEQNLPESNRASAIKKLDRLEAESIVPVECTSGRVSTISVPLSSGPDIDASGVIISRVVFSEEVKAALGERLSEASLYSSLMIALVFGAVLLSGLKMASLLRRMSRSAEAVSSLTFDHETDSDHWERQVEKLSSDLPTDRKDELGVLAQSFQRMIRDILSSQLALRDLNRDLEQRVERRTEELRKANEELKQGRDEARRLARSKDEFLASVSHELRTPLNWLYGAVQFLEMAELDEQQSADVQTIRKATEDLRDLIEDILDYQKIVMDGMSIDISEFQLVPLLNDVAQSLQMYAQKYDCTLKTEWDGSLGTLRSDPKRLKQIIKNLGTNACKFKDAKGNRPNHVVISARREQTPAGEEIAICISDTGRGMRPEEQKKLFHRFERLSSNVEGTGLGLVITRGLVELMKGRIEIQTEFGAGTIFTVRIPVDVAAGSLSDSTITRSPTISRPDFRQALAIRGGEALPAPVADRSKPRKILVVDDDENVLEMMTRYLGEHGFEVITAADGVTALKVVRREHPDLITLDVVMPDLDGWTVLAALKADEQTASIPVVMTTTVDNEERGFAMGADDYLLKPIDWNHLQRVLNRHCGVETRNTVLVVDDDRETRQLLRRQLEQDGWSVLEAEHGKAAIELMEQASPELVLLDLMMPVMNGFEFLLVREEHPQWSKIPVIVLTARDPASSEVEHLRGSVSRILQKGTYTHAELLEEIHRRLGDPAPAGN